MPNTIITNFVGETSLEMVEAGISVELSPTEYVYGEAGVECSGWFNNVKKEFKVAMNPDHWLEIYVHEYCHFTQYKDGLMDNYDDVTLWKWLDGEKFPKKKVVEVLRAAQKLEADNERRTVKMILAKKLPIDIETYIKEANAYIMFHDVMLRKRNFNGIYNTPDILDRMNGKKVLDYEKLMIAPKWFHNEFD